MPSTKPKQSTWVPENVRHLLAGRTAIAEYIEPSAAPTQRLRDDDENARLAAVKLRHKNLIAALAALPDDMQAKIIEAGGDVLQLNGRIEELNDQLVWARSPTGERVPAPTASALLTRAVAPSTGPMGREVLMAAAAMRAQTEAEITRLRPIALMAEPGPEHTFSGLFKNWRGGEDDKPESWRVKAPRHYSATAKLLEQCFPNRDYRAVTIKDAIYFADWINEKGVGTAAQGNHISNARCLYASAWKEMHDRPSPNPFEKVKPVAAYTGTERGKFSYAQLRAILATIKATQWGDNRVTKRHLEASWMLRLAIYTGARISEIAALRKDDLKTYIDNTVSFPYLYFSPEIVKAQKGENKSRETPLHPDIASEFVAFVKGLKGPHIFAGFGGKAHWVVSNFPAFLRDNARALGIELKDGKPVDHKGRPLCQHCLRHTAHKAMNDSRINPVAQRVLVGRKGKDVHDSVYATDMGLAELYKDVCQLKPLG